LEDNPYASPVSSLPRSQKAPARRIRPLWRWCLAFVSLSGMALLYLGVEIEHAIRAYYLKAPARPLSASEIALALLFAYLLLVAVLGRWVPGLRR